MTEEDRIAKQRAYDKAYYTKNAEKKRQKARDYYQAHKDDPVFKEKANIRAKAWYEEHKDDPEFKELHIRRGEQWKEEHKETWLAWRRKRWSERMQDPEFVATRRRDSAKYRAKKFDPYREAVLEAKEVGCVMGHQVHPVCLDFHHIDPTTKKYDIAFLAKIPTLQDLLDEIPKCVVICANHHRMYHAGLIEIPAHITDYTPTKRKNGMIA